MKSPKRRREDGSRSQTAQKRARRFVPDVVQPELHLKMPSFAAPTMERFREDKPERDESDGEPDGHRFRHRRDLFSATSMYMTRLEKNITGQDFPSTFIDSMDEGVSLESQMSGLGAAELAGQCINGAVRKRHRRKHDPQAMFISLFAIKSDVGPAQYFGMPEAMLEECRERSAMAYGMSARQPNGKVWSSFQTLRSGCRRRLVGHETCLMQCGLGRANFVANLNQNSEHVPPGPHVPAFIRASVPWLFALRREGELPEMAEVQGFGPMFLASHYASREHIQRPGDIGPTRELHDDSPDLEQEPCFFRWIRHNQLKDRDLRMGLGNAMVVGIIGAVVLYALACSVRHERRASG